MKRICLLGSECIPIENCDQLKTKDRSDLFCEGNKKICCPKTPPATSLSDSPSYLPSAEKGDCGDLSDLSNIVGGQSTKPGRYPFLALIGVDEGTIIHYKCGGSIINKWYILSAAHCFHNTGLEKGKVNVGDWKISTAPDCVANGKICLPQNQIINIDKVTKHENYFANENVVMSLGSSKL